MPQRAWRGQRYSLARVKLSESGAVVSARCEGARCERRGKGGMCGGLAPTRLLHRLGRQRLHAVRRPRAVLESATIAAGICVERARW